MVSLLRIAGLLVEDAFRWVLLLLRSTEALRAENLFLRRQLALYLERGVQPNRIDAARRVSLALRARLFDWRGALVVVQPATMIRWHRAGWRLLWRMKSRAAWSTFLKNHARGILACDFFVAVTATFRMLYVFVVIEHGTRRLAHVNVTTHPSAAWTLQQLREVIADAEEHKYLIHDRDSLFARHLDGSIRVLGLVVLRSPFSSPQANAICERVIGTIRRECLDWMIPMSEAHPRLILREWVAHYNGERPHSALGSGVPGPPAGSACAPKTESRRRWMPGTLLRAKSVLDGLHHEYSF